MRLGTPALAALSSLLTLSHASITHTNTSSTVNEVKDEGDQDVCAHLWSRLECGYLGISKDGCHQRQCCWAPTLAPVPWCFQKKNEAYVCSADVVTRRDCGYLGIDSRECYDRNCCWDPTPDNLNSPFCFFRQHTCKGYSVHSAQETATGLLIHLELLGGPQGCSRFGQDIARLKVQVEFETLSRINVKIVDRDHARYEIPTSALPRSKDTSSSSPQQLETLHYRFHYSDNPFTFSIKRKATGETLFDSSVLGMDSLVYEDEYLEISTVIPEDANIYGLGEVVTGFRRDSRGTRQTMWARDAATPVDENVYGSHPFYLEMRHGQAHGVFLRNSNGMDVIISPQKLTYKVIGGILDFTIFMGPKPADVIQQYTELIGRPHMPPAWALGLHQSRYGYKTIEDVEAVVKRYAKEDLPLDGVWLDIDYMDQWKDFTYDPVKFPKEKIRALASRLGKNQQNMVLIVDPGIPIVTGYEPFDSGIKEDVFIKSLTGKPIEGRVWPGQTFFPDFFDTEKTWPWWERHLNETREDLGGNVYPWIDMNEPSNFCNGECRLSDLASGPDMDLGLDDQTEQERERQRQRRREGMGPVNLKYAINNAGRQAPLNEKTVAEDAVLKNGLRMYDTHNLYGHMESKATYQALLNLQPNTRPFILTRSSFPGTGAFAAHWTGDNWSEWSHLYFSIPGILSFGLFGIPFTGADICGFNGNTTEELCLRWHQLGALYPFARNHNDIHAESQEPFTWTTSVLPAARQALRIRYALFPYFYTLMERAHRTGVPVWQALFFQFPKDERTIKMDRQFLIGDGVMVSPALYKGQVQVKAYFPGTGRWFDLWTHRCLVEDDDSLPEEEKVGQSGARGLLRSESEMDERLDRFKFLPAKIESGDPIPMSLAGGHIISLQQPRLTVAETRLQPLTLVIGLDRLGNARGEIYVDDGRSVENREWARVRWELLEGQRLVSRATVRQQQVDGHGEGAEEMEVEVGRKVRSGFAKRLGHSERIEKVVIVGLNFARFGGESDMEGDEGMFGDEWKKDGQRVFGDSHGPGHSRGRRVAKVKSVKTLEVDGVPVRTPAGSDGGRGRDSETGVAWEVDQEKGSMTLTGLEMDLFGAWFIHWSVE